MSASPTKSVGMLGSRNSHSSLQSEGSEGESLRRERSSVEDVELMRAQSKRAQEKRCEGAVLMQRGSELEPEPEEEEQSR